MTLNFILENILFSILFLNISINIKKPKILLDCKTLQTIAFDSFQCQQVSHVYSAQTKQKKIKISQQQMVGSKRSKTVVKKKPNKTNDLEK